MVYGAVWNARECRFHLFSDVHMFFLGLPSLSAGHSSEHELCIGSIRCGLHMQWVLLALERAEGLRRPCASRIVIPEHLRPPLISIIEGRRVIADLQYWRECSANFRYTYMRSTNMFRM